ncbi:hypothetical protein QOZ80_5BG0426560 [Eleusine coracana subsp. coracana]|nr:hypothetical protein QOZ80_5BG0426560 [Eleusine coracana subsp. coracana]
MICLALLLLAVLHAQGASNKEEEYLSEEDEFVPVQSVVYRSLAYREPFQTCSECRCCSKSDNSKCVQTRCCYGINCNLPGKPFGTRSFSPRTCGCGPNNCTQRNSSSEF